MLYRAFRHNGQVTDWIFQTNGAAFSVPVESHVTDLATALGVPENEIEAFETDVDPTPQIVVIVPPEPAPDPEPTTEEIVDALAQDVALLLPEGKASAVWAARLAKQSNDAPVPAWKRKRS